MNEGEFYTKTHLQELLVLNIIGEDKENVTL